MWLKHTSTRFNTQKKQSASNMPVSSIAHPDFQLHSDLSTVIDGYRRLSHVISSGVWTFRTLLNYLGQDTWSSSWAKSPRNHGVDVRTCDETWLVQCLNRKPLQQRRSQHMSTGCNSINSPSPHPVYTLQLPDLFTDLGTISSDPKQVSHQVLTCGQPHCGKGTIHRSSPELQ